MKNTLLKTFFIIVAVSLAFTFTGCARSDSGGTLNNNNTVTSNSQQDQLDALNKKIEDLQYLTSGLGTLIQTEYASCDNSGDLAANPLLQKICTIAQAATAELQTQLLSQLSIMQINMQSQIDDMQQQLSDESIALGTRIDNVSSLVGGFDDRISSLEGRMTDAENAIDAINQFNAGDLPNAMHVILIGADNITSGPVFESALEKRDKTQFLGFVETWADSAKSIDSNGLGRTASSATIRVNAASHGFSDGDIVKISGVSETTTTGMIATVSLDIGGDGYAVDDILTVGGGGSGGTVRVTAITGGGGTGPVDTISVETQGSGYVVGTGYTTTYGGAGLGCTINVDTLFTNNIMGSDFNDKLFTVKNSHAGYFDIAISRTATHTKSAFGGASMTALKLLGRQMQAIWADGDPSDSDVRTTSTGTVPYNYIIKQINSHTAALCYDKTKPDQVFATIDANSPAGGGNIVCK